MTLIVQSNSFQLFDGKVDAVVSEVNMLSNIHESV